jgi:molybdate transport system regulatory protein
MSTNAFQIKSRIWISSEEGTFLGEGRIELLKKIDEFGSISKAAKEMGMSYKKAWRLVDSMNKLGNTPLVLQKVGGKGGGGTALSSAGKKAVVQFELIVIAQQEFLESKMNQFNLES